ncbi:hypothetical protein [Amycolatopsis sp. MEPSY49]|uniref:hypothetical protein n=1 Tax=Amycolatopsis sp. MEPSY49 TaxID=3151600 RepID=UPI003EF4A0B9
MRSSSVEPATWPPPTGPPCTVAPGFETTRQGATRGHSRPGLLPLERIPARAAHHGATSVTSLTEGETPPAPACWTSRRSATSAGENGLDLDSITGQASAVEQLKALTQNITDPFTAAGDLAGSIDHVGGGQADPVTTVTGALGDLTGNLGVHTGIERLGTGAGSGSSPPFGTELSEPVKGPVAATTLE